MLLHAPVGAVRRLWALPLHPLRLLEQRLPLQAVHLHAWMWDACVPRTTPATAARADPHVPDSRSRAAVLLPRTSDAHSKRVQLQPTHN
jgi:hypothetical protein